MQDTSPNPLDASKPSELITALLAELSSQPGTSAGVQAMMRRESEFPNSLAAKLTGIALDPSGRAYADEFLDTYWSDTAQQRSALRPSDTGTGREVIIGSGFHAAVYASVRVLSGHARPLVLERDARVGGTFAMTQRPTFFLNSRNRSGSGGLAGDRMASLNYLPGAPIQAANVSMLEYQTNTDLLTELRQGSDSSGRRGGLGGATFRSHDRRSRWAERSFWSGGGAVRESAAHRGPVRAVSAG
jgi:hypothetical protein